MCNNLFIFQKEDTAAVCSNPYNSVSVFVNSHYVFGIKVAGILFERNNAAVFMNNAQTCCSSNVVFVFIRFDCNADLVSCKSVFCIPVLNCLSVVKKLARFCVTAYENLAVISCFNMTDTESLCIFCKLIFFSLVLYVAEYAVIGCSPDSSVRGFCNTVYSNAKTVHQEFAVSHFSNAVAVCCKPHVLFAVLNNAVDV